MTDHASPEHSIDRFAELVALMDDGLTPRTAVLDAAELDAGAWRRIEGQWMARLAAGDDPDIALRFARRYGLTRQSFSSAVTEACEAGAEVNDTLPGVPQGVAPGGPDRAAGSYSPADAGDPVRPPADRTDVTVGCPVDAASRPVLPFADPVAPTRPVPAGEAPPGKRLAYFDTQTGEPLPAPVWVDAPSPPQP